MRGFFLKFFFKIRARARARARARSQFFIHDVYTIPSALYSAIRSAKKQLTLTNISCGALFLPIAAITGGMCLLFNLIFLAFLPWMREYYTHICRGIREGVAFSKACEKVKFPPAWIAKMIPQKVYELFFHYIRKEKGGMY